MLFRRAVSFAALVAVINCLPAVAQLSLEPVVTGLTSNPLFVTHAPGDASRLFIVSRRGQIEIVKNQALLPVPFLNISTLVTSVGETGLLGMAFHPDYQQNGYFYLNYAPTISGQLKTRIVRYQVLGDPATSDVADPASESILIEFDQPFSNHNGGMIAFGPNDGYLYIATGDGGSGNDPNNLAQDLGEIFGKLLRIDVDLQAGNTPSGNGTYAIPNDNPFVGQPGVLPEIWAYGLRNPWRFSFDRATGDLYLGDVGQNAREEIDFQRADSAGGENYGWRILEGTRCNTSVSGVTQPICDALDAVPPIHEYVNPTEGRAVMGGYVYRGNAIGGLRGTFFFADSSAARIWSLRYDGSQVSEYLERTAEVDPTGLLNAPVSFGEDLDGELYLVDLLGSVHKLTGPPPGEGAIITGPGIAEEGDHVRLLVYVRDLSGPATYEWRFNGDQLPVTDDELDLGIVDLDDAGFYQAFVTTASKTYYETPPFYLDVVPVGAIPVSGMATNAGLVCLIAILSAARIRLHPGRMATGAAR